MKAWQIALLAGLLAVLVGGVALGATAALELDRTRLEATRTAVPGSRVVELEERRYNVFYEAPGADEDGDAPAPVAVRLRPLGGGAAPALGDYGGSFTIDTDGLPARAIASAEVETGGRYRLTAVGVGVAPPVASVVLGEPPRGRIVTIVLGAVLAALAFVSALLLVIIVLVRRSRARS